MNEPQLFIPRVLNSKHQPNIAPAIREAWIVRDLSMPDRDWSEFDSPAYQRRTSKVIRNGRRQAAA